MPKELARVVARYGEIKDKAAPLLKELHDHDMDYVLMTSYLSAALDELAERLKSLNVKTADDPRAANSPGVLDIMEDIEKYKALASDRSALYSRAVKKLDPIRAEVAKLDKDLTAVIKAKSGFFSTSKSLPQLKALSVALSKYADDLQTASAGL